MVALLLSSVLLSAAPKAAPQKTELVLDVKPASVVIYLDGRKLGAATKVRTLSVKPGNHRIKLQSKIASNEETISVAKGEKKLWKFDMGDSGDQRAIGGSGDPSPTAETPPAPSEPAPNGEPTP